MNEQQFENKFAKDGNKIKKAFNTLVGDGVSQLKDGVDQFSDNLTNNANEAVSTIKNKVNYGLKQYNSKAQEVADKLPNNIKQNMIKYPWVVISLGLVFGFILGLALKPSRHTL